MSSGFRPKDGTPRQDKLADKILRPDAPASGNAVDTQPSSDTKTSREVDDNLVEAFYRDFEELIVSVADRVVSDSDLPSVKENVLSSAAKLERQISLCSEKKQVDSVRESIRHLQESYTRDHDTLYKALVQTFNCLMEKAGEQLENTGRATSAIQKKLDTEFLKASSDSSAVRAMISDLQRTIVSQHSAMLASFTELADAIREIEKKEKKWGWIITAFLFVTLTLVNFIALVMASR